MPHEVCGFLRRPRLSAHTTAFFDELLNLAIIRRTNSLLVAVDDPYLRREQWEQLRWRAERRNRSRAAPQFY